MLGDKLRFRFAKTGTLRLLSHHDLMRCIERMLRRAELPFKSTAGFHPTPRVHFPLSLSLGAEGLDEVIEIEFLRELDGEDVRTKLNAQAPNGLAFTRVSTVPLKATAMPRRAVYRMPLSAERVERTSTRCAELMAEPKVWVERLRPGPKRLNIRPYFRALQVEPLPPITSHLGTEEASLHLDLWVTQTGSARTDELLRLLELADLLDGGAVITRTTVELHDEISAVDPADGPPVGPAETLPLEPAAIAALSRREDEEVPIAAGWGASPAGPVVE